MKYKFDITGLDCPNCAAKLAGIIESKEGIVSAKINFLTEKLTLETELSREEALEIARGCGASFEDGIVIA